MNVQAMLNALPQLLGGAVLTLELLALSVLLGLLIAVPMALARLSATRWWRWPATAYVFFFRGTPLLVQLFLIYYGLAQFEAVRQGPLWPFLREAYWCALLAFTLNTSAYTAEILRGAIQAVPVGQIEAAKAVGMHWSLRFRRIIWPQAVRVGLPAYSNEVILLLKTTSLASTVTLMDLTGVARTLASETYLTVEMLTTAGLVYMVIAFILSRIFMLVEWKLSADRRPPGSGAWRTLLNPLSRPAP